MTDAAEPDEPAKSKSKLGLILGLVFALLGGGGAFYTIYSGFVALPGRGGEVSPTPSAASNVSFVALDPVVISLGPTSLHDHLRFRAELEVERRYAADVEKLKPRVVDVLNTYLRAIDPRDLEEPSALFRLRAQMLRRVQIVAGPDKVRDLLVMEFVLN
ncbi:MAG: flagellar basal body-associated FliL family protein [Pseudomonadota bacterium]